MVRSVETLIGVLNGLVGDYLERTHNGLATNMGLVHEGRPLPVTREALAAAYPTATARVVILVHGLMSTEEVFVMPGGETYATRLAQDLGYTPLAVRYNSGRPISDNGASLDVLLDALVTAYPVELSSIVFIGHSMGGLVVRSASHAAGERARSWLSRVSHAFYVGTPHLGAPLERAGNLLTWSLQAIGDPVTEVIADVLKLRSSGVKDLRYGNLRREDWEGVDPDALLQNLRHPVPLVSHVRHHLIVGTLTSSPVIAVLFGDGLVPVSSAAGRAESRHRSAAFPAERVRVLPGKDHLRLAHDPEVYAHIRAWCEEAERCNAGEV